MSFLASLRSVFPVPSTPASRSTLSKPPGTLGLKWMTTHPSHEHRMSICTWGYMILVYYHIFRKFMVMSAGHRISIIWTEQHSRRRSVVVLLQLIAHSVSCATLLPRYAVRAPPNFERVFAGTRCGLFSPKATRKAQGVIHPPSNLQHKTWSQGAGLGVYNGNDPKGVWNSRILLRPMLGSVTVSNHRWWLFMIQGWGWGWIGSKDLIVATPNYSFNNDKISTSNIWRAHFLILYEKNQFILYHHKTRFNTTTITIDISALLAMVGKCSDTSECHKCHRTGNQPKDSISIASDNKYCLPTSP